MIEVRVPSEIFEKMGHEVHCNLKVMERLREAGVPIVGRTSIQSVSTGKLTYFLEEDLNGFREHVYQWDDEDEL